MAINPQRQAARKFVEYWTFNRPGSEKSGCQQYWNMLLGELLGQTELESVIRYEVPVQVSTAPSTKHQALSTKFLDAWIPSTRVLIEQKSDYRYTPAVYNNFPWPDAARPYPPSEASSEGGAMRGESAPYHSGVGDGRANTPGSPQSEIEKTAQGILDARALYPDSSLADLYDPLTMPS